MHGIEVFVQDNEEIVCEWHANQSWRQENALRLASEACQFTSVDTFQQTQGSMGGMQQTWPSTKLKKYLQACEKGKRSSRHNYNDMLWNFRATIHFFKSKFLRWAITHFAIYYRFRKATTLFSGIKCIWRIMIQWFYISGMVFTTSSNAEF